jgi:nitric oxide synthase oxygenase domain/subunit
VIAGLVGRFWWTVIHRFSSQQFASKEEMMEFVKIHHCKETTQAAMAPGDTVYECDAGFSVIVQNNH